MCLNLIWGLYVIIYLILFLVNGIIYFIIIYGISISLMFLSVNKLYVFNDVNYVVECIKC